MMKNQKQPYDSKDDTLRHIELVQLHMKLVIRALSFRSDGHDSSKMEDPEKEVFDIYTPRLRGLSYGSEEYKQTLADMYPALEHHYRVNAHHPEHFKNGIDGMNLLDLIEMVCDWMAAVKRHDDGDIGRSLSINSKRFGISEQLQNVIKNTVDWLGDAG